ncbi:beta-1,6-N-acetylglucosaminyltransferase, contains WSC domain [Phaffia rhodozyma]|uniref:Beta-1,6-N-acetylglucosaminyltransferase, contains WSC domain n=1 Tax=Phaffia rhodozyma TaxID=264483 RepID=A0A0F7SPJ7_PHARH|nr:beta-1,6-N-acetylglucosaminyltransferase, contains WSC domain [Phaffia rhodozyma]
MPAFKLSTQSVIHCATLLAFAWSIPPAQAGQNIHRSTIRSRQLAGRQEATYNVTTTYNNNTATTGINYNGTTTSNPVSSSTAISSPAANTTTSSGTSANETVPVTSSVDHTLPTGWNSVGCIAEATVTLRALAAAVYKADNMTLEACASFCEHLYHFFLRIPQSQELPYAGLEYNTECYCDFDFRNGATGAIVDNSNCDYSCGGDPTEICGGASHLSLLQNESLMVSKNDTISNGWKIGPCVHELENSRTLGATSYTSEDEMSQESCVAFCEEAGYQYAAAEYGSGQ